MSKPDTVPSGPEAYFSTEYLKADLRRNVVRGGSLTVVSRTFSYMVQAVGTVVLARLLPPAAFGIVAMATSITGFFMIFRDLGLTDATVQRPEITHQQISTLFWINLAFCCGIFGVLCGLAPLIAWFFHEPRLVGITILSSVSFIFAGLSTQHLALLKRTMRFKQLAAIEIAATLISIVAAVLLALRGLDYWSVVMRTLLVAVVTAGGAWLLCRWRPGLFARTAGVGAMLKFGLNSLGFFFVNYFANNLDKTLIGWRWGAAALGFYHKAGALFSMPVSQMTIPLQSVAVTTLSKITDDPPRFRRYYLTALWLLTFVGMPLCLYLTAMSNDIIMLLLGPKWMATAAIFSILGLGAGIQIIYATQGWLFVSTGRTDRWFRWGCISSAVVVLSFFIGLPFGGQGVALSYTLACYAIFVPGLRYAGRPVGITAGNILAVIWRNFLAAMLAGGVLWYLFQAQNWLSGPLSRLFAALGIFCGLYLALVILLHGGIAPLKRYLQLLRGFASARKANAPAPQSESQAEGRLDGCTIVRFTHAFRSGGGVERYLTDVNRALLERNAMTIIQLTLPPPGQQVERTDETIGRGRLITVPMSVANPHDAPYVETRWQPGAIKTVKAWVRDFMLYHPLVRPWLSRLMSYPTFSPTRRLALNAAEEFGDLAGRHRLDLVVLHEPEGRDSAIVMAAARRMNVPVVLLNHFVNGRFNSVGLRARLLDAHSVGGVSSAEVPRHARAKFVSLLDGIDTEFFRRENGNPIEKRFDAPLVILPARVVPVKGHDALLSALIELERQNVRVNVVFAGRIDQTGYADRLRRRSIEAGLENRVIFTGNLSLDDLRNWYVSSSLAVLPTGSEGLGRVLLEAQAMSLPVIAYRTGGTVEALEHGTTGYLVRYGDIRGLARRIRELIEDPGRCAAMGAAGRAFIERHFSLTALAQRHENWYLTAMQRSEACDRVQ